MHNTPAIRLEPSRSDRMVADSRRSLRRNLARYLPDHAADALLAGRSVDVEVAPEHQQAVMALMPQVAQFVRSR